MTIDELEGYIEEYCMSLDEPEKLETMYKLFMEWLNDKGISEMTNEELGQHQKEFIEEYENIPGMNFGMWANTYNFFSSTDWLKEIDKWEESRNEYKVKRALYDEVGKIESKLRDFSSEDWDKFGQEYRKNGKTGNVVLDDILTKGSGDEELDEEIKKILNKEEDETSGLTEIDKMISDMQKNGTKVHQIPPGESMTSKVDTDGNFTVERKIMTFEKFKHNIK